MQRKTWPKRIGQKGLVGKLSQERIDEVDLDQDDQKVSLGKF